MPRKRWYSGHPRGRLDGEAFQSETVPTEASHGHLYAYVTGPFRTKRATVWASQYGAHFDSIAEAERMAKFSAGKRQHEKTLALGSW